jgi:hypothetical protein
MNTAQFIVASGLAISGVYILVWVGATAWFQTKRIYTKQLIQDIEKEKDCG